MCKKLSSGLTHPKLPNHKYKLLARAEYYHNLIAKFYIGIENLDNLNAVSDKQFREFKRSFCRAEQLRELINITGTELSTRVIYDTAPERTQKIRINMTLAECKLRGVPYRGE